MEACIGELLAGVEEVQKLGMPGRILVFGEKASAVLTGQGEEDTIMACAELGKGRILAFSHTGYGKQMVKMSATYDNSTLYNNAVSWITRKDHNTSHKVLVLDRNRACKNLIELQRYHLLLSLGSKETTAEGLVEEYVREGGALVVSVTPWAQGGKNQLLSELPYCGILLKAGLLLLRPMARDHGSSFMVAENKAQTANLARFHENFEDMTCVVDRAFFMRLANHVPPPHVQALGKKLVKYWEEVEEEIVKRFACGGAVKATSQKDKCLLEYWTFCARHSNYPLCKAPFIKDFPGDFDEAPPTTNKPFSYTCSGEDTYATGCYVEAGTPAYVDVTSLTGVWKVRIGAHVDYLGGDKVTRWPDISKVVVVAEIGRYCISSPFGGGVYVQAPKVGAASLGGSLINVVEQHLYDSQDELSRKNWNKNRVLPGLWADLVGKRTIFTLPSESIQGLDDPTDVLKLYDAVIEAYHDLRGTKVEGERKMWVVADKQPKAGYMHAGHPIVTHLDVANPKGGKFLLDADNVRGGGMWGLLHEMGHMMQRSEWTFDGTSEVTVNIFTLYGMQVISNIQPWRHPWILKQADKTFYHLATGADFDRWKKKPEIAIYIYVQLARCFSWQAYKQVFRVYEGLPAEERPKKNDDKIDRWFLLFSQTVGFNLEPLAVFWNIKLSQDFGKDLDLEFLLPFDELAKSVPDRVKLVQDKFPNLILKEL